MSDFFTGKHDRVFKTIICNDDDKTFLIAILEEILERKVHDVQILRNELPISNVKTISKAVDLLVKVKNKYIHMELNTSFGKFIKDRNAIMFSDLIARKTLRGETYNTNDEFLHVDLNFIPGNKGREIDDYYIQNNTGEKYCENIRFKIFNIDINNDFWYSNNNLVNEKYKYLAMLDLNLEQLSNLKNGDVVIMNYKELLQGLNEKELFQAPVTVEQDQIMRYNSAVKEIEEMKKEIDDVKEQQKNTVLNLYQMNMDIENIAKACNLTISKVNTILKEPREK